MSVFSRRVLVVAALALVVCSCGDDEGGVPLVTAAPGSAGETSVVQTTAAGEPETVVATRALFSDDFQDGELSPWVTSGGWVVREDGDVYHLATADAGIALLPIGADWRDCVVRADVRVDAGNLALNYHFGEQGRYLLNLREDGTFLVKESPPGETAVVARADAVTLGDWHQLAIGNEGGHLQVWIDRQLWIDHLDTDDPLLQGTIGWGALAGSAVAVDNVVVMQRSGPLPDMQAAQSPSPQAQAPEQPADEPAEPADEPAEQPADEPAEPAEQPAEDPADEPDADPAVVEAPDGQWQAAEGDDPAVVEAPDAEWAFAMDDDWADTVVFTVNGGDVAALDPGECAELLWFVPEPLEASLEGQPVPNQGTRPVCPDGYEDYILTVAPPGPPENNNQLWGDWQLLGDPQVRTFRVQASTSNLISIDAVPAVDLCTMLEENYSFYGRFAEIRERCGWNPSWD